MDPLSSVTLPLILNCECNDILIPVIKKKCNDFFHYINMLTGKTKTEGSFISLFGITRSGSMGLISAMF